MGTSLGELRLRAHRMGEDMVACLDAHLFGEEIGRKKLEHWQPADWWQAVRERWAPAWWLRRRPVRKTCVTLELTAYDVAGHITLPENLRMGAIAVVEGGVG